LPADLTLHGLRRSIGTAAVLAGLSAPEVQALLRHRNVSTSSRYIHLADRHRARLQDRVVATLLPRMTGAPSC
jgi:integrase